MMGVLNILCSIGFFLFFMPDCKCNGWTAVEVKQDMKGSAPLYFPLPDAAVKPTFAPSSSYFFFVSPDFHRPGQFSMPTYEHLGKIVSLNIFS